MLLRRSQNVTPRTASVDVYNPTFWALQTLIQMYEQSTLIPLMVRDFQNQVAAQGDTVNTRIPQKMTVTDVNQSNPQIQSQTPGSENVQIKLNQWKDLTFELNDKMTALAMKDLIAEYVTPAAEALTNSVELECVKLYKDLYQYTGTAGTTPAGIDKLGTDLKQKFDELLIPANGRNVVLNPSAENEFHKLYWEAQKSGSTETQRTGQLMRKFSLDFYGSTQLGTHTKGTGWGTPLINGAQTAAAVNGTADSQGPVTISVKGLSAAGVVNQGDLILIGGNAYTLTAGATASGGGVASISISPKLAANVADGDPITVINTHKINLAFHNQTFALATRPLDVPTAPGADVVYVPYNGLGLRVARWYDPAKYRQYVRMDLLFGVKTLDPRKGYRLLG